MIEAANHSIKIDNILFKIFEFQLSTRSRTDFRKKEGRKKFPDILACLYGRFRIIDASKAPTIATATMIAIAAPRMYILTGCCSATGCAVGVAAGSSTAKYVCAYDP